MARTDDPLKGQPHPGDDPPSHDHESKQERRTVPDDLKERRDKGKRLLANNIDEVHRTTPGAGRANHGEVFGLDNDAGILVGPDDYEDDHEDWGDDSFASPPTSECEWPSSPTDEPLFSDSYRSEVPTSSSSGGGPTVPNSLDSDPVWPGSPSRGESSRGIRPFHDGNSFVQAESRGHDSGSEDSVEDLSRARIWSPEDPVAQSAKQRRQLREIIAVLSEVEAAMSSRNGGQASYRRTGRSSDKL